MSHLDLLLFRVINRDLSNGVLDLLMPVVTDPTPFLVPLTLVGIALVVWGGWKGRLLVVLALLLLLVSNTMSELLKLWIQRPRPCQALEGVRILVGCSGHSFSFPSSHATNITAQALFFSYFYRRVALPLFLIAATVGYSRVYVGVHYPADVGGGVLVGLICAACFVYLARKLQQYVPTRRPMTDDR